MHPSGGIYRVVNDGEIPYIEFSKVLDHFKDFIVKHPEPTSAAASAGPSENLDIALRVEDILTPVRARRVGDELKGGCPFNGHHHSYSMFRVNLVKNTWFCERCRQGGGVATAIAAKHLMPCDQLGKGILRGKLYAQVLDIAEKEYGWKNTRDDDVCLNELLKNI